MSLIKSALLSIILLFSFSSEIKCEPLKPEKGKTEFIASTWAPAAFKSQIGDLELNVYFLMPGVGAPIPGVLIGKDDFNRLEFIGNRTQEWCDERLVKERLLFDAQLKECRDDCKNLNFQLIKDVDDLNVKIKNEEMKKLELSDTLSNWKIGSVSAVLVLSGLLIYQSVK